MSEEKMPLSHRYDRVRDLLSYYGYESHYMAGNEDGTDWEVSYSLRIPEAQTKAVSSNTEEGLLDYLRRRLPDEAQREWRGYALRLEAEIGRLKRGGR